MQGLNTLAGATTYLQILFGPDDVEAHPVYAKGDHDKAYRWWPVHPSQQQYLTSLIWDPTLGPQQQGGYRAYIHRALPFGAVAAVGHYTRISQGVCQILRKLFGIPQIAYVDDFLRVVPAKYAAACEDAFRRVHAMLGIPLKAGKEEVSERVGALGHTLMPHARWVALQISERRRAKLTAKLEFIERQG